jgi:hypothetical protein
VVAVTLEEEEDEDGDGDEATVGDANGAVNDAEMSLVGDDDGDCATGGAAVGDDAGAVLVSGIYEGSDLVDIINGVIMTKCKYGTFSAYRSGKDRSIN